MDDRDRAIVAAAEERDRECIFLGCVSRDRHWHGPFWGGYTNPEDPEGAPIPFTSEPEPGVRDYNGALLAADQADAAAEAEFLRPIGPGR